MYRQDPIVKTAQQIVLNRLTRNRAWSKRASKVQGIGGFGGSGHITSWSGMKEHSGMGLEHAPWMKQTHRMSVTSLPDVAPPTTAPVTQQVLSEAQKATENQAAKAGFNLWQAIKKTFGEEGTAGKLWGGFRKTVGETAGKIWAKPVGRYGTIGAGSLAGAYGLYRLLAGGGGEEPVVPVVPVPPQDSVSALAGPAAYSVGGGQVIPSPVGVSDFASYLDLLRANQPIAGAAVGALGGAALGAGTSRKNRIRNALIGLVAGAALGGGAGYLTQGRI